MGHRGGSERPFPGTTRRSQRARMSTQKAIEEVFSGCKIFRAPFYSSLYQARAEDSCFVEIHPKNDVVIAEIGRYLVPPCRSASNIFPCVRGEIDEAQIAPMGNDYDYIILQAYLHVVIRLSLSITYTFISVLLLNSNPLEASKQSSS